MAVGLAGKTEMRMVVWLVERSGCRKVKRKVVRWAAVMDALLVVWLVKMTAASTVWMRGLMLVAWMAESSVMLMVGT